jgi:mono/diheme cytochrome c family protein
MTDDPNKQGPAPDTFEANRESDDLNVRDIHGAILREKDDPRDGYEPIPLWLVSGFMALVFWAGAYLAFYSGGFQSTVFDPTQVAWAGASGAGPKTPPDPKVLGKRLFTANCVACHQSTGLGVPGQFPPLVGSEWVVTGPDGWHGDNHLVSILLHGLQGPIQVKGNTYNGAMPPWQQLKDEEIAAILTYIRSEWGNEDTPISAEDVAKIRAETATQKEPYTQAQLQAIAPVQFGGTVSEPPAAEPAAAPQGGTPPPPAPTDPAAPPAPAPAAPAAPAA